MNISPGLYKATTLPRDRRCLWDSSILCRFVYAGCDQSTQVCCRLHSSRNVSICWLQPPPTVADLNRMAPEGMRWDPLAQTYQYDYCNPFADEVRSRCLSYLVGDTETMLGRVMSAFLGQVPLLACVLRQRGLLPVIGFSSSWSVMRCFRV